MRILHSVGAINERFGGPSRTVPALCDSIAEHALWVGLAYQHFYGMHGSDLLPLSRKVESISCGAIYAGGVRIAVPFGAKRLLSRAILQNRVELIHDHGVWQWFNHSTATAAHAAGIPRVVSPRGMLMQWPMSRSRAKKAAALALFQGRDLKTATGFTTTSEEEARDIRDLGFRQPIAIVPNGVAMPPTSLPTDKSDDRRRTVRFLSRIHPKKGLQNLINAWARVRPQSWQLIIAGPDEGGHRAELEAVCNRLAVGDSVVFNGMVQESEKWAFLQAADIVILPSESENFGMVVAEALALGIPVVASTGTPWKSVADLRCGWWVGNDVESLASTLLEATAMSPGQLRAMGERGFKLAKGYSWSAVGKSMVEFYQWLLGRGQMPSFVDCKDPPPIQSR